MNRAVVTFLIAPLIQPAALGTLAVISAAGDYFRTIHNPHNPLNEPSLYIGITVGLAVVSYGGAIVFGIPGYLWLRKLREIKGEIKRQNKGSKGPTPPL